MSLILDLKLASMMIGLVGATQKWRAAVDADVSGHMASDGGAPKQAELEHTCRAEPCLTGRIWATICAQHRWVLVEAAV